MNPVLIAGNRFTPTALPLSPPAFDPAASWDAFLTDRRITGRSKATYNTAFRSLAHYLKANAMPFSADGIAAWIRQMEADGKKPNTIKSYLMAVKSLTRWACLKGLCSHDLTASVRPPQVDKQPKKLNFTPEQEATILKNMPRISVADKRAYAIAVLLFFTGMRCIEVNRAMIEDLQDQDGHTVLFIQGKGRKEKADKVILSQPIIDAISDYLEARTAAEGRPLLPAAPLFASISHNSFGKPLTTRSISMTMKTAFRSAGYDSAKWTAHSTRHSAITEYYRSTRDVFATQRFARHSSPAITAVYVHIVEAEENPASQILADSVCKFL